MPSNQPDSLDPRRISPGDSPRRIFGILTIRFASIRWATVGLAAASLLPIGLLADDTRPEFRPKRVVRPFPAIESASFIEGKKVKDEVRGPELVIGVVIGGKERAYPINQLTRPTREIINDRLGGRSIAATW